MEPELWRQVEDIYHQVLKVDETRRAEFLNEACKNNEFLRGEVESLLEYEKHAGQFIEAPAMEVAGRLMGGAEAGDPATQTTETQPFSGGSEDTNVIGPYRLIELIGQGGMGEVWLAEQKEPVRRRVAIKLIKAGMDTHEVIARFQSERQALAMMDHPAIAKVFDAGSTASGRPYFVMEYVPGLPITIYSDSHKLSLRSRLELFIQVCEGVQHAHQKAIIHRDLKPSNILVTEVDGKPMVRIIDFGIAKATSQQLTPGTIFTRRGSVVGTIGYMSPEQADSGGQDIDTRSDVYSLGVILYELLAGALPLDFRQLAFDEVLRSLREQDPPRPSTMVQMGDVDSATAQNRGVDLPSLARQLRGDPDAIALKALEKDRKRRYSSSSELANDIGRLLRDEPVNAHAPSVSYRARKYIRRHRLGVALASAAVLLFISFAIIQAIELQRIKQERDRADREAQASSRVADFLTGVFSIPNPTESRGNSVTARELLDKASTNIESGLGQDAQVQSRLMRTMGNTYLGLGLYAPGRRLLQEAVGIQIRTLGAEAPETLLSSMNLGRAYQLQGNYDQAEKLLRQTVAAETRVLGSTNEKTMETLDFLANTLTKEAHYAEAEKLLRRDLADQQRVLGPESVPALTTMNHLVANLRGQARLPEAENLCRETLALRQRVSGPDDPATLSLLNTLAILVEDQGRISEAEGFFRQGLASLNRVLGPEHPNTLATYANLGRIAVEENHLSEAEQTFRIAIERYSRTQGPEYPTTLALQENLGSVLGMERKLPESEKVLRELFAIELRKEGPNSPATFHVEEDLALTLAKEGSSVEAESLYRKAVEGATHSEGPEVPDALYSYAAGMALLRRRKESFQLLQEALDHGFSNADQMASEADFQSLHSDPRFETLVSKARQAAANHP